MAYCPICGRHHDPAVSCADGTGDVLKQLGLPHRMGEGRTSARNAPGRRRSRSPIWASSFALLALLASAHAAVTLACVLHAFAGTSARFDDPAAPVGFGAAASGRAAHVLVLPLGLMWTRRASSSLPNSVEWLLFAANSVVWGASGSAAVCWWRRTRSR
jgi:hypothetical protein